MKDITGIILSGGKSQRMGTDKAFLPHKGKLLIEHSIDLLKPVCSEILISANDKKYNAFGFELVPDEIKNCGPIGGIYSTLKKSSNSWNFIVSCDTPFINNELLDFLLPHTGDCNCVVPIHNGKKEPLLALYNKSSLDIIYEQIKAGNFKMHFLLEKLNCSKVDVGDLIDKYPRMFANFNSPGDICD